MSDKIKLAPGQQTATYDFEGVSFADLGQQLDEFYADIDYDRASPSGHPSISVNINVLRSYQNGVERVSLGNYCAYVNVNRRGLGE